MQAETRALQVGVIVPVFNEADNVAPLVKRLTEALRGYVWEVIFVDDSSPDGSAARVRAFALLDPRVRRSEEHTSELQSLMRISYAVFCLKKKHKTHTCMTAI